MWMLWFRKMKKIQELVFLWDFSGSLIGNINDDGIINILDVVVLVNIVLGMEDEIPAGDLNSDGMINVLDVVILVNIILGG